MQTCKVTSWKRMCATAKATSVARSPRKLTPIMVNGAPSDKASPSFIRRLSRSVMGASSPSSSKPSSPSGSPYNSNGHTGVTSGEPAVSDVLQVEYGPQLPGPPRPPPKKKGTPMIGGRAIGANGNAEPRRMSEQIEAHLPEAKRLSEFLVEQATVDASFAKAKQASDDSFAANRAANSSCQAQVFYTLAGALKKCVETCAPDKKDDLKKWLIRTEKTVADPKTVKREIRRRAFSFDDNGQDA